MAGRRSNRNRSLLPRLKLGFAILIGLSAALMTLAGDGSLAVVAGAGAAGVAAGLVAVWIAFPAVSASQNVSDRQRWR